MAAAIAPSDEHEHRKKSRLAPHLVGAAFWSLREAGAIGLELRKSKSLGFISRTELIASIRQPTDAWHGMERDLLAVLPQNPSRDVGRVVRDWFGKKVDNAGGHVLSRVLAATEETGLLEVRQEDAGRGKVAGLLRGKSTTVIAPDAGAIGAARADIARVADGWTAFGQTNGELATELVKRCQR